MRCSNYRGWCDCGKSLFSEWCRCFIALHSNAQFDPRFLSCLESHRSSGSKIQLHSWGEFRFKSSLNRFQFEKENFNVQSHKLVMKRSFKHFHTSNLSTNCSGQLNFSQANRKETFLLFKGAILQTNQERANLSHMWALTQSPNVTSTCQQHAMCWWDKSSIWVSTNLRVIFWNSAEPEQ